MKKGKRVKPKFPIEYRLLITPRHKQREKEVVTLVALRTVNEFKNFLYELGVEPTLDDRTLHLKIHGLRAPQVTIPGSGPAKFIKEFKDLHGKYSVVVSKPNGEENSFEVNISTDRVVTEKSPKTNFVDLVVDKEEW